MQVLVFVFAFLTAIAVLTQAQVGRYRDERLIRRAYIEIMRGHDFAERNNAQQLRYDRQSAPSKEGEGVQARIVLNGHLNIAKLLDPAQEITDPIVERIYGIAERLLVHVYADHPSYVDTIASYPQPNEAVLDAVMREARASAPEKRPKALADLAKLDLGDEQLQELLYRLLKDRFDGNCDVRSPSLNCFFDVRPTGKLGLSIYKAPSPLLQAIFEDDGLVVRIKEERDKLWKAVDRKEMATDLASDAFANQFGKGRYVPEDGFYDFRVNTVVPPQ